MANILEMLGLQPSGIAADPNDLTGASYGGGPGQGAPSSPDPMATLGDATGTDAPAPPGGNVLQAALAPAQPAAAPQATQPARVRSSLLDHIGRVADVLAQVGGAAPLYQPTLDARQNRALSLGDHDRSVAGDLLDQQAKQADITQTHGAIATTQNALTGAAVKHLQAIIAANPGADVSKIWPMLASQAGIPADQTAALGQMFASDPKSIGAMAGDDDGKSEAYGGQPIYATDPEGNLHVFQAGLKGNEGRDILPKGWKPADPTRVVNLGGTTAFVGQHSDQPSNYVPNTEKPGTEADRAERAREADNRNALAIYQADAKAHGGKATANPAAALGLIDNLQQGFDALHNMSALPGDTNNPVMGLAATIGRTGVGQWLSAQAGTPAGQMRQQVYKNLSLLQQEMIKSLPASATRSRFEQEIIKKALPDPAMLSYDTANNLLAEYRQSYSKALSDANQELSGQGGQRSRPILRPYGGASGTRPAPAVPVTKPVLPSTPRGGLHDFVPWGSR